MAISHFLPGLASKILYKCSSPLQPNILFQLLLCVHEKSLQSCLTLCNPMDYSHQAPLSMGFSRQEYWSRLPCRSPGDLPNSGIKPPSFTSPVLAREFFTTSSTCKAEVLLSSSCSLTLIISGPLVLLSPLLIHTAFIHPLFSCLTDMYHLRAGSASLLDVLLWT